MINKLKYSKLNEGTIVVNTLPKNSQATIEWQQDHYSFELAVTNIKDGYFELEVLLLLTAIPKNKSSLYSFKTSHRFSIKESEIQNYELAYSIILVAIENFNYLLSIQQTTFVAEKRYHNPHYKNCIADIEENYFFSSPQLLF